MKRQRLVLISLSSFFILSTFFIPLSPCEKIHLSSSKSIRTDKFNLLLITIDTLRTDRLSCYNPENLKTPNIDSLAAKSVVFTRAFAHTSTTLPSHANILLGTTPLFHGVHDNSNFKVREEHLTLAEHLKQDGYSTGAFVGAFPLDSRFGLSQGFDTYDGDFGFRTIEKVVSKERPAEIVVENALEWVNQRSAPWFLWIHCYDPHDPYEPPEPFRTKYSTSLYDGEVAYVDYALKKLFQYLEDNNLFEKTVIVFTGDHGESLGEHGEMTHGCFAYNSTIWIPLFVFIPGMKPQTVQQYVTHVDLFPTICDALEIEKLPFLHGISLIPVMKGKKPETRTIYFESLAPYYNLGWAPIRGIIQDRQKFINSPIPELYDLEEDFDEAKNLAQKSELSTYRKKLSQIIQIQESKEKPKAKLEMDREALEMLRSLGYIADYRGEEKRIFNAEDDAKILLPYHNKSIDALKLYDEGKVREGTHLLKEVITEKKTVSQAYSSLAWIYKSQGKLNDAIQVLEMGLEFNPESYIIFSSYVDYLSEAGRWNEIISVFEGLTFKQVEYDPGIWNFVGMAYSQIGDFEKALMFCERAVSIDKKFPVSYISLGKIHSLIFNLTTNPQELPIARLNYEKALELDPKSSTAHDGLGLIHMYEGNYDEAIHHLEMALELKPGINHAFYNLGLAHLKKGNKTEALSYFDRFKSTPSYLQFSPVEKEKLEKYIKECKDQL